MNDPLLYTHKDWPGFSAWHQASRCMRWEVRPCNYGDPHPPPSPDSVIFYTNSELEHAGNHRARRKVAFMLETRFVAWWTYEYVESHLQDFDAVLTYDRELLEKYPGKCVFYPHGGCSIAPQDRKVYDKTKLASFWASVRKTAPGHFARHEFYELYSDSEPNWTDPYRQDVHVDCFGQLPHNYAETMLDCLRDYRFQIVMENNISDTYFTEKLIDCLATGTIPIYRGTRRLGEFFDTDAIIYFDTMEELFELLPSLSPELYESKIAAVHSNAAAAEQYVLAEDWIYRNTDLFR